MLCITDVTYLFQESNGSYSEGGLLDIGWPSAVMLIGFAACAREQSVAIVREPRSRFAVPALFSATSLALLVYGQRNSVAVVAIGLAVVALGAAALRTALTVREVTSLYESRREARTDELTGLRNRRGLLESLSAALLVDGDTVSLVILDLDRFKEVNDSLGHVVGDQLLHAIGGRLDSVVRPHSQLARLGGDEFAVVLVGSERDAAELAIGIRRALTEPFSIGGVRLTIDASIGIARFPDHGNTTEALMAHADLAMYPREAQPNWSRNVRTGTRQWGRDRMRLLSDLRVAGESEQFELHYQPQMDLRTGDVVGIEALIRWRHPELGLVAPDVFLPLAEQCNLMHAVTAFVLQYALRDVARLRDAGFALDVSVNVSGGELIDTSLPAMVANGLATHGLPPQSLVIEVTENSIMSDRVRCLEVLHVLAATGVRVSVDDYGTGYASLAYLRDLPVGELKLDRAFLVGVPGDAHNAAIVRSTIELAHALDLPIVAEGIEQPATLEWLRTLGCDLGQGFHIARPLPFDDLVGWLQNLNRAVPAVA